MPVPANLTEYLARKAILEEALHAKRGSTNGELLQELEDLLEFVRQNAASLPVQSTEIFHGGFVDYNDAATATTPLNALTDTPLKLTNDAAGAFTTTAYLPQDMTGIWDSINNQFDWSELKLGDMVDIRFDIEVTTTQPNQNIDCYLTLAVGSGGAYNIPFITGAQVKTAGAHPFNRFNGIYMGDANTLNNPAEFYIDTDAPATVKVNGWYCKIIRRGAII